MYHTNTVVTSTMMYKTQWNNLSIGEFKRGDLEGVIEVMRLSNENLANELGHIRRLLEVASNPIGTVLTTFLKISGKVPLRLFVAHVKDNVVGTALLTSGRNYRYVSSVAVHPNFRRQGIATALMEEVSNHAKSLGYKAVLLHVDEANTPAVNLYSQLGFKRLGSLVQVAKSLDTPTLLGSDQTFHVREAVKKDVDDACKILRSSSDLNDCEAFNLERERSTSPLTTWFLGIPRGKSFIALDKATPVGFIHSTCTLTGLGLISGPYLFNSCESSITDAGEALIMTSAKYLKASGLKRIIANISPAREKLINLYRKIGFTQTAILNLMVNYP